MEILYILLIILVLTRGFGELAIRLGQPMLVGELIAGIFLGVIIRQYSGSLPILSGLTEDKVFIAITDLGIFFLMLLGGIEMRPKEIAESAGGSFFVALSALIIPLAAGFGFGWILLPSSEYKTAQALFIGTGLAITALPVAIRVLMDLKKMKTREGQIIISAAFFEDVLGFILVALLAALIRSGGLPTFASFMYLIGKIAIFFVVMFVVGRYILPRVGKIIYKFVRLDELEFSFLLIIALGFAVLAEMMNTHFILGAFGAGLFFSGRTINKKVYEDVKNKVSAITTGFLAPIFFASIGLHLDLSVVTAIPGLLALLIFIAIITKLIGATFPAYWLGFSVRNSLAIGVAMSARGAIELIIADIALRAGLFSLPEPTPLIVEYMFSAIVLVAIVTTIFVPVLLRLILSNE